jgi:hypothetical protein
MADTKQMPSVGQRCIHKETPVGQGPLWEVKAQLPASEEVKLEHAKHKVNTGLRPEAKLVPVEKFNEDYKLL